MWNKYQTQYEDLNLDLQPEEVKEQFLEAVNNIPFVKSLISADRPRAKDLKKDSEGKIIIDVTLPHLLEDMDYFRPSAIFFLLNGCYTKLRPNPNPNSEYYKWAKEEIRRCFEGYIRPSDGEWITGDMYFFLNYCPIQLTKKDKRGKTIRVIDFPKVWDGHYYKFHYLNQCRLNGKHAAELSRRGAHPYTEKVFTPQGWKLWSEIQIGSELYGTNGKVTKVIDIPYDKECDYYKITLRDGREVLASDEHLWIILEGHKLYTLLLTTKDLLTKYAKKRKVSYRLPSGIEHNCFILKNNGVDLPFKKTKIDPYTFGLLLGDGCFRHHCCYFTQEDKDIDVEKSYIPYLLVKWSNKYAYRINIPNWLSILKSYGLYYIKSEGKFIPDEYKYNDRNVRLNVLKGLFDSDGWVHKGLPTLSISSERLRDDVIEIARSLGYNCSFTTKTTSYKKDGVKIECNLSYVISVYADNEIFNLPRKKQLVHYNSNYAKSRKNKTVITNIEYLGVTKCKCVTVDSEDSCYLIGDFITTHNCGKSYVGASLLAKRFILGESYEVCKKVLCVVTASEKKYILGANQILDMFQYYIDFNTENTQFPNKRITSSLPNMQWIMGYVDKTTGARKGSENSVIGITSKDDESKLRGSRGVLYLIEEAGTFARLLNLYQVTRPSVEDGDSVWGLIFLYGTAGDNESDFSSMQELMYNPRGYNINALPNVYDKEGLGRREFTFFFPGYLDRADCYDKDGNSDVTKALLQIYNDRYTVKYNSTNINAITKRIAEIPITPLEAVLRTRGNMFPVTQLNERLNELDNNPSEFDDVYVGDLAMSKTGKISWVATNDKPLREFPLKDNKANGAIEIFKMPEKDKEGNVFNHRYIAGVDPIDDDASGTVSLVSCIILDLWTDKIVCEWTGRLDYADDCYERIRLMLLFYNARCLYENNKKGMFAYFSRMNCLYLLADCPDYLRDKDMVKGLLYGNKLKGVNATLGINNYANEQIKNWLIKPVTTTIKEGDEEELIQVFNLFFIRNRALLKELILFNPDINVDRVRALGMCMLLREERVIMYQGDIKGKALAKPNTLASDPFFMQDVLKPKEDLLDYHPHIAEIDFSNINVFKQ